jgi:hypothetical protein
LLFGEFCGKGIGAELSIAQRSGDELADEVQRIASTQIFFRPGGFDSSHGYGVQRLISSFELRIIRSGSGRYPVDPVRMRSVSGQSEGVLIGVEAVCFHNWLILVSGGVRARRCVFSFTWVEANFRRDPGAWRRNVQ